MKILIVEDHPTNRKLLHAQLEAEGHEVVETADGAEALVTLNAEPVDLVISDILMPNIDGFRLCQEVRANDRLADLPIILYTSTYNSPADRELAHTVGADLFVSKPAPPGVLQAAIRTAMRRGKTHKVRTLTDRDENYVLKRYSAALVRKLEEKNAELESALAEVQRSNEAIRQLNSELESRVERRTRQLAEANRELEAFSFTISHDLRAPLRRIDGFAHVLEAQLAESHDGDVRTAIDVILKSVGEMGRLISDLLAFSRTSRVELQRETVSLDDVLDDVLASLAGEMQGREVVVTREPLPRVHGDPALLHQVLMNLVGNAVKYTRPRTPGRIVVGCQGRENDSVVLKVADNGVGFDPAQAGKLFGVFQRLHSQEEFEGTGIGLAIVQRIVERHKGRTWAESRPGEGATFYFTLPAANPRA